MPLSLSQVGPLSSNASLSSGLAAVQRAGNMGEQIISELQGRYYEAAYRQALFNAANQAATTTTVGLATTYTGLCLSNPIGSGKNVVVLKCGVAFLVAPAAALAVGIMVGYNSSTNVTHTTPGTPRSSLFGTGATGVALVDTAATLPTAPVVHTVFGANLTAAITTAPQTGPNVVDLEGSLILPPGAYAAFYTSAASGTSSFLGSFSWMEVPQ